MRKIKGQAWYSAFMRRKKHQPVGVRLLTEHTRRKKHQPVGVRLLTEHTRRKKVAAVFASISLAGALALAHDRIGISVWNRFPAPRLAILLHPDAQFAVAVGNYYFNIEKNGIYDLDRAAAYFKKALDLDPRVPGAWHQLARIDFLRGAFVPGLEKINKQIAIHGDSFMASYYIRGLIKGYMGNLDAAEKDFLIFKAWDPYNWAIRNDLAWIYFQKGDFAATEREAREGLELNNDNSWLLTARGVALLNLKRTDEAKAALTRAEKVIAGLTESDWHKAYPGNDPRAAPQGLSEMRKVISQNLLLLEH